jgi:hypothetical protein
MFCFPSSGFAVYTPAQAHVKWCDWQECTSHNIIRLAVKIANQGVIRVQSATKKSLYVDSCPSHLGVSNFWIERAITLLEYSIK